jgi:hypothetical protein
VSKLAEAFTQLEGIKSARVVDSSKSKWASVCPAGIQILEMMPDVGDPMILYVDLNLPRSNTPGEIAEFYSENIAQRVRARRGECIFCGASCGCAEFHSRRPH